MVLGAPPPALLPKAPATRATLAGLLWGDQPEDAARASLSKCLSNLRDLQSLNPALRARALVDDLKGVQILLHGFLTYPPAERPSHAQPIREATQRLKDLRNTLMHAPSGERPAYSLDDEA